MFSWLFAMIAFALSGIPLSNIQIIDVSCKDEIITCAEGEIIHMAFLHFGVFNSNRCGSPPNNSKIVDVCYVRDDGIFYEECIYESTCVVRSNGSAKYCPLPFIQRRFMYACTPGPINGSGVNSTVIAEFNSTYISCPSGKLLYINSAFYLNLCTENQTEEIDMKRFNGHAGLQIVLNGYLNNSCTSSNKLNINYICLRKTIKVDPVKLLLQNNLITEEPFQVTTPSLPPAPNITNDEISPETAELYGKELLLCSGTNYTIICPDNYMIEAIIAFRYVLKENSCDLTKINFNATCAHYASDLFKLCLNNKTCYVNTDDYFTPEICGPPPNLLYLCYNCISNTTTTTTTTIKTPTINVSTIKFPSLFDILLDICFGIKVHMLDLIAEKLGLLNKYF